MKKEEKYIFGKKKRVKALYVPKKLYLCTVKQKDNNRSFDFGLWCNGNTTDSGPVFLGSNPSSPTSFCSVSMEEAKRYWAMV